MPMNDDIYNMLNQETYGPFPAMMLQRCRDLVKLSRDQMVKKYAQWDDNDMAFNRRRKPDADDRNANNKGEPTKMVIPLTYSQIETFVAFGQQVFTQRPTFYEFGGVGGEDEQAAKLASLVLEHNLRYNRFYGTILPEFLRSVAKFGFGVIKHSWHVETTRMEQEVPMQVDGQNVQIMQTQVQDVPVYQGNKYTVISPYRFFPDPRLPMQRFQEGEFCASEDEYSEVSLQKLENQKMIAGLRFVEASTNATLLDGNRRVSFTDSIQDAQVTKTKSKRFIITEVQIELIPKKFMDGQSPLGDGEVPEKWLVWIANDTRIVRMEPMGYLHNKFTYVVGQYTIDSMRFVTDGLADVLDQMQSATDWFINSRITNVRNVIGNKMVVDPRGIELSDLANRNPVIRLKPIAQGNGGVDRYIKQLDVRDVTTGHISDAQMMRSFSQDASGISENLLGQFSPGRRSASEANTVNSNGSARVMLILNSLWDTALLELGRQSLSNCRDGMDIQQLINTCGMTNVMANQQGAQQFITADKSQLVGSYDFLDFDGTLPSQRGMTAMALQELLIEITKNPQLAFIYGIDPKKLLRDILILRGIRNPEQYSLDSAGAQQLIQLAQLANNAVGAAQTGGAGPAANSRPAAGNPQQ